MLHAAPGRTRLRCGLSLVVLALVLHVVPLPARLATFPVSEIRRGQVGEGITRMDGGQRVTFKVHILGVLDGVSVSNITPQVRDQMSIPPRIQGAIITQVDPSSASARQGLQPGDVILELDRQPVRNAEEAVRLSEEIKGPKVMVRIWRDGRSQYLVVDESAE